MFPEEEEAFLGGGQGGESGKAYIVVRNVPSALEKGVRKRSRLLTDGIR